MKRFDKKGLSGVVTVMILVGLTVGLVAIIWTVTNNLVQDKIKESSCFEFLSGNKVTIDSERSCYQDGNLKVLIGVGDIYLDSVVVVVLGEDSTKSFTLTQENQNIAEVNNNEPVKLPDQNSGLTYTVDISAFGIGTPNKVEVYPVLNGVQCEAADSLPVDEC